MGIYINPRNMSKENWLENKGTRVTPNDVVRGIENNYGVETSASLFVCLVDNGPFTAAGICDRKEEAESFLIPDGRSKWWFIVPKKDLEEFLY